MDEEEVQSTVCQKGASSPQTWSLSVLSSYFHVVHRLHMTKASKQSPHWTAMNCNSVLELVLKAVLEQNAESECLLCLEVALQSK